MANQKTSRPDVYTRITDTIVQALEQGTRPWMKPWSAENTNGRITKPLRHHGIPYTGINIIMLWSSAVAQGFAAPIWMTYRQANELGAQVRKGERGSLVVYANTISRTEQNDNGEEEEHFIPFMKGYTVFNVEQIDSLPEQYYGIPEPVLDPIERIESAENFFASTQADIRHGGNRAYYSISSDHIQMPHFQTFTNPESYYAVLAHESTHWTRHDSRLHRDFGRKRFGDEGYAMEELVAELGSAFLSADLELTPEIREDHASYIESWIKVLKDDKRAIFTAAAHAQRAADFLHSLQPQIISEAAE